MTAPTSVYQYYDKRGVLIYVGITNQGVGRQLQHNRASDWWAYVASQDVEHYDTREIAAARETFLIRNHRPPFNKQQNGDYQRMNAAYLTLFGNRSEHPDVGTHPCIGCEGDEPPCAWPNVEWFGDYACGVGCDLCHAQFHGYEMGVPVGYEAGEGAGLDSALQINHDDATSSQVLRYAVDRAGFRTYQERIDVFGGPETVKFLDARISEIGTSAALEEAKNVAYPERYYSWMKANDPSYAPPDPWADTPRAG